MQRSGNGRKREKSRAAKGAKAVAKPGSAAETFYEVIRNIPRGRVTTYGTIARLAGKPRAARQVGFALARLVGGSKRVPWQRVLGAKGRRHACVTILDAAARDLQRTLLEREGVRFDASARVSLPDFGWPTAAENGARKKRSRG